jgi:hypothetical protein
LALVLVVDSPHDPEEKYQLIVQSTTEERKRHESTPLREWKWSPTYHRVSCNTIVDPGFVISISHKRSTVAIGDKTVHRVGIQIDVVASHLFKEK